MPETNKELMRRVFEMVNSGDLARINDVIDGEMIEHEGVPGGPTSGPAAFIDFVTRFRAAFPDLRMTAEDTIAESDRIVCRFLMSGTHNGDFMGLAPSGKSFTIAGFDMIRCANGKIVEHWGVTDSYSFMQQLGAIPT